MLNKGPFALFYGGNQIIPQLSENSPIKMYALFLCSAIFQVSLYILKHSKSRKLNTYKNNLIKTLVENVLNIYGIVVLIIISMASVAYSILHHWNIQKNQTKEKTTKLVPTEIIIIYGVHLLVVVLPYIKSYALR